MEECLEVLKMPKVFVEEEVDGCLLVASTILMIKAKTYFGNLSKPVVMTSYVRWGKRVFQTISEL